MAFLVNISILTQCLQETIWSALNFTMIARSKSTPWRKLLHKSNFVAIMNLAMPLISPLSVVALHSYASNPSILFRHVLVRVFDIIWQFFTKQRAVRRRCYGGEKSEKDFWHDGLVPI